MNYRSLAKFDAIVAGVRRELSYSFEGLQTPPPRWEDEAFLSDTNKQLVMLAGVDENALRSFPFHQVPLRDFVVAGQDADFPLSESESLVFSETVRNVDDRFENMYQDNDWHPQISRLVVELKLISPVADSHTTRIDLLSPLRDVLDATLILPPLPEPIDLDVVDTVHREFVLETSLFIAAELQLPQPLQEQEAVHRIRSCLPHCPANLIGNKVRLAVASERQHWISFRVRQF